MGIADSFLTVLIIFLSSIEQNQSSETLDPNYAFIEPPLLPLYPNWDSPQQQFKPELENPPYEHILGPPFQQERQDFLAFGSCIVVLARECPHSDVSYHLYTRSHPDHPETILIGTDLNSSNITSSRFNASHSTKVIIHGYNSDMYISALAAVKTQYLDHGDYNVFAIDWSPLAHGPCYPAAVWNSRFAGRCSALLIQRLRELNVTDIHVIGFSLGAHVCGFMANHLTPYKIPRITGLDPAMPGFAAVSKAAKLDSSDAEFVDVIHTNAFGKGKVEQCGHVDFYCNGGVVQPGCWSDDSFFSCNHHRAPFYFAESITTNLGFYGWNCPSYLTYLLGGCPPRRPQTLMGEYVDRRVRGMQLVITDSASPFAVGQLASATADIFYRQHEYNRLEDFERYRNNLEQCEANDIVDPADAGRSALLLVNGQKVSIPEVGHLDEIFY